MNSNQIAQKFFDQGYANHWLSEKQTAWLYRQYCQETGNREKGIIGGAIKTATGKTLGWSIDIHPGTAFSRFIVQSLDAYVCKHCSTPVEQAIEGELICNRCWSRGQMSAEERKDNDEIEYALSHCNETGCEACLRTEGERQSGYCRAHMDSGTIVTHSTGTSIEYYLTHCKRCGKEIPEATVYCNEHKATPYYKF